MWTPKGRRRVPISSQRETTWRWSLDLAIWARRRPNWEPGGSGSARSNRRKRETAILYDTNQHKSSLDRHTRTIQIQNKDDTARTSFTIVPLAMPTCKKNGSKGKNKYEGLVKDRTLIAFWQRWAMEKWKVHSNALPESAERRRPSYCHLQLRDRPNSGKCTKGLNRNGIIFFL